MSDDEVEVVLNRKSRFTRYRQRVRETIDLNINEAMQCEDSNSSTYELLILFLLSIALNY